MIDNTEKKKVFEEVMNNKVIKEFWNNDTPNYFLCKPNDTLYHYTSANALSNIIQKQEFWLTKADFMNDISEVTYAVNLFKERLDKANIHEDDKKRIKESLESNIKEGLFENIYILSLSANRDSLPMWSYYGKSDGYNIEISKDFVSEITNAEFIYRDEYIGEDVKKVKEKLCVKVKSSEGKWVSSKIQANYVLYDPDKQKEIFDIHLDGVAKLLKLGKSNYVNFILSNIAMFIPFMKDSSYRNEEEYRILVDIGNENLFGIQEYRVFKGALVPYIVLKLNKDSYFKSITMSPFNNSEYTQKGLDSLVKWYPRKLDVLKSKIPARF